MAGLWVGAVLCSTLVLSHVWISAMCSPSWLPRGGIVGRGGIVDEECTMSYTGIVSCLDFCYVLGLARHCNLHQQKTCRHWWGTVLVIANDITKQYRRSVFLSYISFI